MRHIIRQRSEPNACQRSSDTIFIHLFRFQLRQAIILNQKEILPLFHPKLFRHLLRLQQLIPVSCLTYRFCKNPTNPIIVSLSWHIILATFAANLFDVEQIILYISHFFYLFFLCFQASPLPYGSAPFLAPFFVLTLIC